MPLQRRRVDCSTFSAASSALRVEVVAAACPSYSMQIELIKIKPTRRPKAGYTGYPLTTINAEKPFFFYSVFGETMIDLNEVTISPASFQVC